ncbi:ABC transporter permease [Diaphorobacter caeni]|uniref:ABC transporter permease n=1 Tax=Diaphorobacter caeni TaxID=2784387 RepID=UPI00188DFAED|nr:ABC transporter permease [Diaphorobacter caeni]MBF5007724.1 ABC transporter permease [Diaphorobacter caeni]
MASPLLASLRREARLLRGRPWDLAMISWVPLLAVLLLAWIFAAGLPHRLPIAVWDQDHSTLSRQLVRMLGATPGLSVRAQVLNASEAQWELQSMTSYAVVQIPPDFARDVKRGLAANVVLMHNAQLATHSSLIQRDVRQVVGTLSAGVEMQARAKRGDPRQALQMRIEPVRTSLVSLFNISTNYEQFLAAALIPALLHILGMTAGAWSVGRELRDCTLGDWVQESTGGRPAGWSEVLSALAGKLALPWLSLTLCGMLALLWLTVGRGWTVAGSFAWVALGLTALVAVSLAMGALLAALTLSLRTALSGAGLLSAPAFAFSGVGFPLLAMPASARGWALSMPYTHYARLQLEQFQMGASIVQSLPVVCGLVLATLVLTLLATAGLMRGLKRPDKWGGR